MAEVEIEFYSPKTLAQRWSKSRSHIYDLIAEGKLRKTKWGRSVMIHRAEVQRFEKEMGQCEQMGSTSASTETSRACPNTSTASALAGFRLARSVAKRQSAE